MRRYFFPVLVLILFSLSGVLATDVAYVVRDVNNVEANVVAGIEAMNFSYELIDDSEISSTDFDDYGMILVWDELLSGAELLPIGEKNSLVANTYYLEDWGIADYAGSQVSTGYVSGKVLVDNMISDGFQVLSSVNVYNKTKVVLYHLPYYFKRAPGIVNVISTDNYHEYPVVGMINAGGKLYSGGSASERIAFFGMTEAEYWSSDSVKIFKNTLQWVLMGEDGDGDGVFYDEDCDDSDSDLWRILFGYVDDDGDGFGVGELVDVCSGDFLPIGYSDIDGDCDDLDDSYNLDSDDVYKNCVNDAPIVPGIVELVVNEGDVVVIDLNVSDPEFDVLGYEIDDGRFTEEDGVFSWETGSDDEGFYVFVVVVSDGEFEVEVEVEVEILNQLSVWDEIPDVEWDEDTNFSLDLNLYVLDGDGDNLSYFVNSTSSDKNISVEGLEGGIVEFSVERDWNGEDWIVFAVWDGSSVVESGNVTLRVLSVNDAPVFSGEIENEMWDEESFLEDAIDLNDYFSDVDLDVLEFGVVGNDSIDVEINQESGVVSFYSGEDWFGNESVVFFASDGFDFVYSNVVGLVVVDANEVPEFGEFVCEVEIDEDVVYECELNASDFEGDDFWFSVIDSENVGCDFDGDDLIYVSESDYFGGGSCFLRVSDGYGYSEILIEFEVLPVNDVPEIVKYSPVGNIRLMENVDEFFSVVVFDVDDGDLEISWSLDSKSVAVGDGYLFNQGKGDYSLEVVVSDGEDFDSYVWDVFIGDVSDFTCEEVGGFVFDEDEICLGDVLGVLDVSCCSIVPNERPPEFSDAKTCSSEGLNLSSGVKIDIMDPDGGDEFAPGEEIYIEIEIENDLDEDLDFDVEVYLYDVSDEDSVDNVDDKVDVNEGDSEVLEFVIDIDDDIDDENDYVVFVRVFDKDGVYCNEKFVKIDLERAEDDVKIESFKVVGNDLVCEDFFSVEGRIKNFGSSDQDDVVFSVRNSELGIFGSSKDDSGEPDSEGFELERFGGDDDVRKSFDFRIPDDAGVGSYKLEGVVSYGNDEVSRFVDLNLGECRKLSVSSSVVEPVSLGGVVSGSVVEEKSMLGFVVLIFVLILLFVVLGGFVAVRVRKGKNASL